MRKLPRILAAIGLVFLIAACGDNSGDSGTTNAVDSDNNIIQAWPDGVIHYAFDRIEDPDKERIRQVMDMIEADTQAAIIFVENGYVDDYVVDIYLGPENRSTVGSYVAAYMSLADMTNLQIAHELLRVIGLRIEWQRPDRDEYVTIDESRAMGSELYKYCEKDDQLYNLEDHPYDYSSLTTYGILGKSFQDAIDGKPLVTLLYPENNEDTAIGSAYGPVYSSGLSQGDIDKIKAIYN